ncbi:hypothetical protein F2Q70_00021731 [Brassica cretica]|uniref:Uncharacterized protein n=1 Tax=Brassica cretica TaxID=69181 RepID=A0A8S9GQU3_BRACR|nr:hypothetical protein F2Q70_00021731 [Brassica cretica]
MDQGHEDTMMGSHPGGRVTACSVGCSILEYLMEMMVTSRWETFTLGREGMALASGYVCLGGWPKVPGFISGTLG